MNQGPSIPSIMTHDKTSNDHGAGSGGNGGEVGAEKGCPAMRHRSPQVLSSPLISAIPNQVKAAHATEGEEIPAKTVTYLFRSLASHSSS